jgi:hypothetical protein
VEAAEHDPVAVGIQEGEREALVAAGVLERVEADEPIRWNERRRLASATAVRTVSSSTSLDTAKTLLRCASRTSPRSLPSSPRSARRSGAPAGASGATARTPAGATGTRRPRGPGRPPKGTGRQARRCRCEGPPQGSFESSRRPSPRTYPDLDGCYPVPPAATAHPAAASIQTSRVLAKPWPNEPAAAAAPGSAARSRDRPARQARRTRRPSPRSPPTARTLTPEEEARAAELEAQIVSEERQAEQAQRQARDRQQRAVDRDPAVRSASRCRCARPRSTPTSPATCAGSPRSRRAVRDHDRVVDRIAGVGGRRDLTSGAERPSPRWPRSSRSAPPRPDLSSAGRSPTSPISVASTSSCANGSTRRASPTSSRSARPSRAGQAASSGSRSARSGQDGSAASSAGWGSPSRRRSSSSGCAPDRIRGPHRARLVCAGSSWRRSRSLPRRCS